jgi:hypothetical protein
LNFEATKKVNKKITTTKTMTARVERSFSKDLKIFVIAQRNFIDGSKSKHYQKLTRPETRHVKSVIFVIFYFYLDYWEKV